MQVMKVANKAHVILRGSVGIVSPSQAIKQQLLANCANWAPQKPSLFSSCAPQQRAEPWLVDMF
jgi:hypothetical protein